MEVISVLASDGFEHMHLVNCTDQGKQFTEIFCIYKYG